MSLKIRDGQFKTITRARGLESPTDLTRDLWLGAKAVFDEWAERHLKPLRLLGVTAIRLSSGEEQLNLFADAEIARQRKVDAATDRIAAKFGRSTLFRGSGMTRSQAKQARREHRASAATHLIKDLPAARPIP